MAHRSEGTGITAAKTPSLSFVNLSHPDEIKRSDNRKAVRYHAMKEVGKARRKKRQHLPVTVELEVPGQDGDEQQRGLLLTKDLPLPLNSHGIVGIQLDSRALHLLQFLKVVSELQYRALHVIWIRIGLSDPTCFCVTLATAVVFISRREKYLPQGVSFSYVDEKTREKENLETVKYYAQAIAQLRTRMQDDRERVSHGVIATILGFICHDANFGCWDRWAVHMEGLLHLYRLRGGFDGMGGQIPLLAFWLDLAGRAVLDTQPQISVPIDLPPLNLSRSSAPPALQIVLRQVELAHPTLHPFVDAMAVLANIARIINPRCYHTSFWQDELSVMHLVGPLIHYLLSLPRLPVLQGDDDDNVGEEDRSDEALVVGEMLRLTCLLVLSDFKGRASLNDQDGLPLGRKLTALVSRRPLVVATGGLLDLQLWCLVTYSLLAHKDACKKVVPDMESHRAIVLLAIREIAATRGIATASGTVDVAEGLLWFETVTGNQKARFERELDALFGGSTS